VPSAAAPELRFEARGVRGHRPRRLVPWPVRDWLYEADPRRRRRWSRWPGFETVGAGRRAVLTFDDGPDEGTLSILDALDAADARATFFVLGEQVDEHPWIASELLQRGHELGVHGYRHARFDRLRPEEARSEIVRAVELLESLGCTPRWFRPPFGRPTAAAFETCQELGLRLVYWSSWGVDWGPRSARRIAARVGRGLTDGAIVLLHDSARYAERRDVSGTAEAVRLIATEAHNRGLELVAIGAALDGR
jgi:peptidoglycan/xylan/chitin deacetylase (PgdA/CDA1 family)